ncbi:MAG TPA: PAS domain-containing protein, partial [Candidatus Dormibacteraeota bacterium]|nr:PAS domain-containing protein [Candidatus Dormibacteraeota bacterium]
MSAASQALQWALGGAFGLLGLLTLVDWLRHRDHSRRYLAASIGLLGTVAVISTLSNAGVVKSDALIDATLVLFLVSGWTFLLFRDTLVPLPRWLRLASGVLVLVDSVLLLVAYAPGTVNNTMVTPLQTAAGLTLVAVWGACVCEPIYRIWRLSHRLPSVQRARARSLVAAYAAIVLILVMGVVAGFVPAADSVYRVAATPLAALVLPLFYLAFAPPRWIRRFWREGEEREFRLALGDLLLYSPDRETLAQRAVEWATRLLGASTAVLATDDGKLLVARGIEPAAARELAGVGEGAEETAANPPRGTPETLVQTRLDSQYSHGVLAVKAGPLTPLFGAEEVARLQDYASSVTTALDRVLLVERLRRTGELLDLAYNPILTWSAKTGTIRYWNHAAETLYGWTAAEAVGRPPSELLQSELPIPRDDIVKL